MMARKLAPPDKSVEKPLIQLVLELAREMQSRLLKEERYTAINNIQDLIDKIEQSPR